MKNSRIITSVLLVLSLGLGAGRVAAQQTWHVNVATGSDDAAGRSPEAPFKTIQKACDVVNPGDKVIVYPGVYFENIELKRSGTADKPIVFMADAVGRNRVVVTLADRNVREGKVQWTLEDTELQLYSIPFKHTPVRVIYDGVDLFPYATLDALRKLMISDDNPGPFHGFALDAASGKLYVRLHHQKHSRIFAPTGSYGEPRFPARTDLGKYGSADPNRHIIAIAPKHAEGVKGSYIDRPDCYVWGVLTEKPAHVVLDGFTFETPAVAGVYVRGSDVTVRNCWFVGCKAAVAGGPKTDNDDWPFSDNVTVEQCDFTQFPAYTDVEEVIAAYADDPRIAKNRFFWWARKGNSDGTNVAPKFDYEVGGIVMEMGKNWVVRNNDVYEVFDGLSAGGNGSEGLRVHNNRFARVVDNAVQTENHGTNWRIHGNEFIDNFMAISWQPLAGTPWPGPIYLYRNLIYDNPECGAMWRRAGYPVAWFKAGARDTNWKWPKHMKDVPKGVAGAPGDGFVIFNNTVVLNDGYFLERVSGHKLRMENFKFYNNIFVTQPNSPEHAIQPDTGAEFDFAHNLYSPSGAVSTPVGQELAGKNGVVVTSPTKIGFVDQANHRFELQPGSPAIGAGMTISSEPDASADLGAIPFGKTWVSPVVGPQPR